jgi:NifU-like protein involved in Fe-S cluster formation
VDPRFEDHFRHPRGVGRLAAPTHTARVEDPACGDRIELDLEVREGRVVDARYRVSGCSAAIALGSALVAALPGRPARADAVSGEDLERAVGGLAPGRGHARDLALAAFARALGAP